MRDHFRFNFWHGITDITGTFGNHWGGKVVGNIQEVDALLRHVRRAVWRFGISLDAAMTQQILLLGDAFYGYRFAVADFAVVWSAVDQTIKVYDRGGQLVEALSTNEEAHAGTIPLSALQSTAA